MTINSHCSHLQQVTAVNPKEKKKETNASQTQQANTPLDERSSRLLFVDSLTQIELLVSFASLSRWYEQKQPESIGLGGDKMGASSTRISAAVRSRAEQSDHADLAGGGANESGSASKELTPLQMGSLMAEPYSWKSLVCGQPCLRIHTTAIRSTLLTLPPGRHVLKFMMASSPIAYHIHIVSNTCFAFGDEEDEEFMNKLTDV